MEQPNYLDYCTDDLEELYSRLQDKVLKKIVERIIKTGAVTPSAKYEIELLEESGMVYDDVLDIIAEYTELSQNAVSELFNEAKVENIKFDNKIYEEAGLETVKEGASPAINQILRAAIRKTNGNLKNLTMTTASTAQSKFIDACSIAEQEVETGAFDLNTALRHAVEYALQDGVNVDFYNDENDSEHRTARRNIVSAVRTAVLTGVSQTTGEISLENAKKMGTDLMELSAHQGARPSHALWQGKIVCISNRKTKYLTLNDIGYGEIDGFKGINCRHNWFPFIEGVSKRTYTDEQLEEMNNATVTYNGKEIPLYEATQKQRAMERQIRKERGQLAALNASIQTAKSSGNDDLADDLQVDFDNLSVKLKAHEAKYKDFCGQTGLPVLNERLQYPAFNRSVSQKAVRAAKRYNMANNYSKTEKDLLKTEPVIHTEDELSALQEYANERNIRIHQPEKFTGDSELLKEQIDVINNIKGEFGYDKKTTIMFKNMPPDEYGQTSKKGNIWFNNLMLRDKKLTNRSLNEDNILAATDIRGIAAHEMGHVLSIKHSDKGLEIAQEAYYNVYNKPFNIEYLYNNVSTYSVSNYKGQYNELIPEIISKNLTDKNDFTKEFIRILKEKWEI